MSGKRRIGVGVGPLPEYDAQAERNANVVGRRIEQLRNEKQISLTEMAKYFGQMGIRVDRTTISKWEHGVCSPNAYQFIALCKFFGIDSPDFFTSRSL